MKLLKSMSKPICKLCFKDIKQNTLLTFFHSSPPLCHECLESLNIKITEGKIGPYPIMSMAEYTEPLSKLLITYKENLDIELAPIFFGYYVHFLHLSYLGYYLVPAPSSIGKVKKRGFSHLIEMYKPLNLPFIDVLKKADGEEQKRKNAAERKQTAKLISIENGSKITGKKILLVDDVITSGTTIMACIHLLEKYQPQKLKILVLMNDSPLEEYKDLLSKE